MLCTRALLLYGSTGACGCFCFFCCLTATLMAIPARMSTPPQTYPLRNNTRMVAPHAQMCEWSARHRGPHADVDGRRAHHPRARAATRRSGRAAVVKQGRERGTHMEAEAHTWRRSGARSGTRRARCWRPAKRGGGVWALKEPSRGGGVRALKEPRRGGGVRALKEPRHGGGVRALKEGGGQRRGSSQGRQWREWLQGSGRGRGLTSRKALGRRRKRRRG